VADASVSLADDTIRTGNVGAEVELLANDGMNGVVEQWSTVQEKGQLFKCGVRARPACCGS